MVNAKVLGVKARKQCLNYARKLVKTPLPLTEPITGFQIPEVNYFVFTGITLMGPSGVKAFTLPTTVSQMILPMVWNYLDAASCLTIGLNQLLDEDDYRQTQNKIKGLGNILAGVQLFLLTYNPPLAAALGVSGAPAILASSAAVFSALNELLSTTIDFYNAYKEKDINGWMDEKCQQYSFYQKRIEQLKNENENLFDQQKDQSWIETNKLKIIELQKKQEELEAKMLSRYRVNMNKGLLNGETFENLKKLFPIDFDIRLQDGKIDWSKQKLYVKVSDEDTALDIEIQKELDAEYQKAGTTLIIKTAALIGLALLTAGTFSLFATCPPAVPAVGLAVAVLLAALFIYRYRHDIVKQYDAFRNRFFSAKNDKSAAEQKSPSPELGEQNNDSTSKAQGQADPPQQDSSVNSNAPGDQETPQNAASRP